MPGCTAKVFSEPAQPEVPLRCSTWYTAPPGLPAHPVNARRLHIQVRVIQAGGPQQSGDERCPAWSILHHNPVQVRDVQERVGEAGELGFLHSSGVGGRDDVDGGQQFGPRWTIPERTFTEDTVVGGTFFFEVVSSYVGDLMPTICQGSNDEIKNAKLSSSGIPKQEKKYKTIVL